jgi:phosphatidate phosphatase APP1
MAERSSNSGERRKAAEDSRTPRPGWVPTVFFNRTGFVFSGGVQKVREVLECGCPLPLWRSARLAIFESPHVVSCNASGSGHRQASFPFKTSGQGTVPLLLSALSLGVALFPLLSLLSLLLIPSSSSAQTSNLKPDQDVVFYPALAYPIGKGKWEIQFHGCVFEPEKRVIPIALLRQILALDHVHFTAAENKLFKERARLFMIDEKGGRRIVIRLGDTTYKLGKSQANGQFVATLTFTEAEIKTLRQSVTNFQLVLKPNDTRQFTGDIHYVDEAGVIVISDIDDTIKVTAVGNRNAALRNTFLLPFKAVDGMPELYRGWAATNHAEFFYVSASPWQLYAPLADFIHKSDFPPGAFFLKTVDIKDKTFFALFENPDQYKPGVIEPLMKRFPHRKFVLVGDSGEQDPEIYAALARKFPGQVSHIFIRDLSGGAQQERFSKAFEGLAPGLWKTFTDPSEISVLTP